MQIVIDVQVKKAEAVKILNELEAQGVKVTMAREDLKQRSNWYNVFYAPGMTEPCITYSAG